MRFGLVGSGPQAQRYLSCRNGGQSIVTQVKGRVAASEYRSWLGDDLQGVIIATHPAAHYDLVMAAIEAGVPVLCEKPLALTWAHCDEMLRTARARHLPLEVAHTRLWSADWRPKPSKMAYSVITYSEHERDYSPWLDWAPHGIAALAEVMPWAGPTMLMSSVSVGEGPHKAFNVYSGDWGLRFGSGWSFDGFSDCVVPPMFLMVRDFINNLRGGYQRWPHWYQRNIFNRRVYEALFWETNGQGK